MRHEFKLQDPGEGIREVEVLEVLVAEGDAVEEGQDLLVVESDKAAIELPSPHDGAIAELRVKEGDTVEVGDVLLVVDDGADDAEPAQEEGSEASRDDEAAPKKVAKNEAPDDEDGKGADEGPDPSETADEQPDAVDAPEKTATGGHEGAPVRASPAARRLARERGIDLAELEPGGAEGQVTVEDVRRAAPQQPETDAAAEGDAARGASDRDEHGPVERRRMSAIRAATARSMARSWSDIPHVVHEDAADITELERWRRRQEGDGAPTLTPIVAKAVAAVLKDHPSFNASIDVENQEIVLRRYLNINFAVATDHGLVTPVIKGVDGKSIREIADEMAMLAEKARARKLRKSDIVGGTFTITNVGAIGGRGMSPLINPPQCAILGLTRARVEAVALGDIDESPPSIAARLILPLTLAFDHRVIDGADAARFVNDLAALLSDPVSLALDA